MVNKYRAVALVVVLVSSLVLTACGRKGPPPDSPEQVNPFAGLPFVLVPGPTGELEPRDANGKPLHPSDTPPSEGITAIRSVSQVLVLKVDGSCWTWIYVGGQWYKVPC
ncbi:MAG: LPS translocon maturation chaperone LptM [Immundisolibacter sp.]|uniref:LPS translocon maturation chaperone LptM n=1 Tax=Immundisolibacter sp. TaxID=1934948 RepID=UPI003EE3756E